MKAQLFLLHAIEPLHPGVGQGAGTIDLPISREKPTLWPRQVGSGLKGPLRDACPADDATKDAVFGTDGEGGTGAAQFADARILLFPIASWRGTFAYVTSPLVLQFLREDLTRRCDTGAPAGIPLPNAGCCLLPKFTQTEKTAWAEKLSFSTRNGEQEQLIVALDEFDIPTSATPRHDLIGSWAIWIGKLLFPDSEPGQKRVAERFCVVDDNIFSALVQTGTEVIARIRLDDQTKTVVSGQLWFEELLPRETVLAGVMTATRLPRHNLTEAQVLETAASVPLVQLGGKAGVGRGHCRLLVPDLPPRPEGGA